MLLFKFLISFFFTLQLTFGYRILVVFPTASFSHQKPQIALSKALAAHGHHLTILSPDPFETTNPNITQISLKFLYKDAGKLIQKLAVKDLTMIQTLKIWKHKTVEMYHEIFQNTQVQEFLNDKSLKFDAVIVEYVGYPLIHALAEKYNATLIGVKSLQMLAWAHQSMGNPTHPILHPLAFSHHSRNPGIIERIQMIWEDYEYASFVDEFISPIPPLLEKYVPENKLTVHQLLFDRVDLAIECISPAEGFVRPILPNTKQIGFIHIDKPKPLPKDLQEYLDNSKKGVIYVSFGNNVKSVNLDDNFLDLLKTSLGSLPYDVLWKYEINSMPNQPKNVKTISWAPQLDVLGHSKVRLFITQAGFQSLEETIAQGVPVVMIPFFADQSYNAGHMENLGIGKKVLKSEISIEKLKETILEVIKNPKYKEKTVKLGNLVRDTPMNATETAVWYIEHAIRNRGTELFKYRGRDVPFYEFYFLDIIALVLGGLFVFLVVLVKILKRIKFLVINLKKKSE